MGKNKTTNLVDNHKRQQKHKTYFTTIQKICCCCCCCCCCCEMVAGVHTEDAADQLEQRLRSMLEQDAAMREEAATAEIQLAVI